jgi:hypothetical protein
MDFDAYERTRGRGRITGIFAALRAGLKLMFEQPRPATGGYGR